MSETVRFRLGELLGTTASCDFLSEAEIIEWAEGRLDHARFEAWSVHAETCPSCTALIDDFDALQSLGHDGLTVASEQRAFDAQNARARRRLRLDRSPKKWRFVGWLVPTLAFGVLLAVVLWPSSYLIREIEDVPFAPPPAVRGASAGEPWQSAQGAWEANDFSAAERVLATAADEHPDDADFAFYLGIARLELRQWEDAAAALRAADVLLEDAPSETVRWALATALDRDGEREEACAVLQSIAAADGARAEQALSIVEDSCR